MRKSLASLGFPLQAVPKFRTFGISNDVDNTSSAHQEPHIDQDGVISPCVSTPHAVDGRPVAQPESVSVKHHAPQGDTRRNDGQQVHHAEEERRICPRDPCPDELGDGRSAKARCGKAQVDLEYGQAAEATVSSSGRMEEARCGCLEGDIREGGMSRSGQGQRQALGKMESTPAGHRNRDVAHGGDGEPDGGRHLLRHPHVPEVSDPTFGENKSSHQRRFLWMRPLSITHSDSTSHLRGTAHQGGSGPAECTERERREPWEEDIQGRKSESRAQEDSHRSTPRTDHSDELRASSSDGSWVRTGRVGIEASTEGETETAMYNTNLTPEEMKLINDMRKAKESGAK